MKRAKLITLICSINALISVTVSIRQAWQARMYRSATLLLEDMYAARGKYPATYGTKTTNYDLPLTLLERNHNGRYNELILEAMRMYFNDEQSPLRDTEIPKLYLISRLKQYPELSDILKEIYNGTYNEPGTVPLRRFDWRTTRL